jgi:YHS domain-containing protein
MFRLITYLLIGLFLVTVVRSIVGVVLRGFSEMLRSHVAPQANASATRDQGVPLTGELKKDPVCGTYTPAGTSLQQTVRGQTFYFCSAQCRDKYLASLPV